MITLKINFNNGKEFKYNFDFNSNYNDFKLKL
jgi:hypothetical protein